MSKAQDVLTRADSKDADILDVIEATLNPLSPQPERVSFAGPSLLLTSQQVLGMSLALHELATNATKYGALSNSCGVVEITWSVEDDRFQFLWAEKNGPEVKPTARTGFGSTILQQTVGAYFNGASELKLERTGAVFTISGSLDI